MPVCAEARTWVLCSTDIFYFLRQAVSVTNLRLVPLARLAGQLGSRTLYLRPLPLLGCPAPLQKAWAFHIHSGDPNSGPHNGAVDTLQTKPSPLRRFYYFIGASPLLSQGQGQAGASWRETSVGLALHNPGPRAMNGAGTEQVKRCKHPNLHRLCSVDAHKTYRPQGRTRCTVTKEKP